MLHFTFFDLTRLVVLVPCALFAASCSDDGGGTSDGATQSNTSAGTETGGDPATSGDVPTEATGTGGEGSGGGSGSDPTDGLGPDPVPLGTAGNYVILAKSAIANVPTSVVT